MNVIDNNKVKLQKIIQKTERTSIASARGICAEGCNIGCSFVGGGEEAFNLGVNSEKYSE